MSKTSFENLDVYRLAEKMADEVWSVVADRDYFAKNSVGMRLVDAADSVSANVAEGCGRFNYKDNARFISHCERVDV